MDARKTAAAVSAAGAILIAGCGGGGKGLGGSSVPSAPNSGNTAPANSSRVGLSISVPKRQAYSWTTSSILRRQTARTMKMGGKTRSVSRRTSGTRQPKYLSEGLIGGSVYVSIYQGGNLALTDGPLAVGFTPSSQLYCYGIYSYVCTGSIYAPLGDDTFYVSMYDVHQHLLAVTPGQPGTNFYGPGQPSYTITSSGYPSTISVNTYAFISNFGVDTPTSCIAYGGGANQYISTDAFDGGGYLALDTPIANPFTITVTGGFQLYSLYPTFAPVATPFTVYAAEIVPMALGASGDGATGTISISSATNSTLINGSVTSMNLYEVDRLALAPTANGLNVTGLLDSGPAAYACGTMQLATYDTATPVTFTNPAAIGADDFYPGFIVIDNVSGTAYANLADLDPGFFGLGFETYSFVNAVPVVRGTLPGSNPLDVAVSPYGVGNSMIYVLNADGSISEVNTNTGSFGSLEPASTVAGASGIGVLYSGLPSDSLFVSSSTSGNATEIDGASTGSPASPAPFPLASPGNSLVSPVAYSVATDNLSGEQYVSFLVFDSGDGNANAVAACSLLIGCPNFVGSYVFNINQPAANGLLSLAWPTTADGSPYDLAASGMTVYSIQENPLTGLPTTFPTFSSNVSRIISSYDLFWNGVDVGGTFSFFYNMGSSAVGSLAGTRAVIVSP